ncbi:flagellar hook-length control protein FliK [Tritonibacter horizontis]|uniref:Flagellar hook-length control protein FliK n=1 Tax=Tritonibacter horizontis TaxID=1768241 RepID=A0A132C2F7_9RHOB|nr:flagellar hook-length control protein FliK [Tritonibacter horizontis]
MITNILSTQSVGSTPGESTQRSQSSRRSGESFEAVVNRSPDEAKQNPEAASFEPESKGNSAPASDGSENPPPHEESRHGDPAPEKTGNGLADDPAAAELSHDDFAFTGQDPQLTKAQPEAAGVGVRIDAAAGSSETALAWQAGDVDAPEEADAITRLPADTVAPKGGEGGNIQQGQMTAADREPSNVATSPAELADKSTADRPNIQTGEDERAQSGAMAASNTPATGVAGRGGGLDGANVVALNTQSAAGKTPEGSSALLAGTLVDDAAATDGQPDSRAQALSKGTPLGGMPSEGRDLPKGTPLGVMPTEGQNTSGRKPDVTAATATPIPNEARPPTPSATTPALTPGSGRTGDQVPAAAAAQASGQAQTYAASFDVRTQALASNRTTGGVSANTSLQTAQQINAEAMLKNTSAVVSEVFANADGGATGDDVLTQRGAESFALPQLLAEASVRSGASSFRAETPRHVAQQLAEAVATNGKRNVDVSLNPRELGHVNMRVSTTDTGVMVFIQAERPETEDLMRRHIQDLAREFKEMGFSDISFQFGSDTRPGQSDDTETSGRSGGSSGSGDGDAMEADTLPLAQHLNISADGLDIRI